jgi:hypothetical protein
MGVDLFDALGSTVRLADMPVVSISVDPLVTSTAVEPEVTSSVSLDSFPTLTKATGTLRGFVHKPHVDTSIKPVRQRFWHPPLAMRDAIAAELRRMGSRRVIERIDASPWISSLVQHAKKMVAFVCAST